MKVNGYPKSVMIFGEKIKIAHIKDLKDDKGNDIEGQYCPETKKIQLRKTKLDQERLHTLIHEMVHATWNRCSLTQTSISEDLQELVCDLVATVITENFNIRFKK